MIFQSFRKAGRITVVASADSNSSRELQKQVIVPEYDIPGNGRIFTPALWRSFLIYSVRIIPEIRLAGPAELTCTALEGSAQLALVQD